VNQITAAAGRGSNRAPDDLARVDRRMVNRAALVGAHAAGASARFLRSRNRMWNSPRPVLGATWAGCNSRISLSPGIDAPAVPATRGAVAARPPRAPPYFDRINPCKNRALPFGQRVGGSGRLIKLTCCQSAECGDAKRTVAGGFKHRPCGWRRTAAFQERVTLAGFFVAGPGAIIHIRARSLPAVAA